MTGAQQLKAALAKKELIQLNSGEISMEEFERQKEHAK